MATVINMTTTILWAKPRDGFVSSRCGRFTISPVYCGSTRPETYSLFYKSGTDERKLGDFHANQRDAKRCAQDFYNDIKNRHGWRQSSPFDQLTVIRMAIEGHVDNLRTIGFHPDVEAAHKAYRSLNSLFSQLEDLEPFLRKGKWDNAP